MEIIDATNLTVDKTKPVYKRLTQYIEDVKNPYFVKVGDICVHIEFGNRKSFFDALADGIQI